MPSNNILAEKIYKRLLPRVEETLKNSEVKIKDVLNTINKSKATKARGNDNLNMYVLKQISEFLAICITHIINSIIRKSIFPSTLKTSRIIPIYKKNKDKKKK